MSILNDTHYPSITELIANFAEEVDVQKPVFERMVTDSETLCTMCVFYTSSIQKDYLVVIPQSNSFDESLPKLSEALHLFSARNCHSVLVTIPSKVALDNVVYSSINFFIAATHAAYVYYLPYTVTQDPDTGHSVIIWHDNISFAEQLSTADIDQSGIDFVNLLHAHVNVEAAPFDASEVLNYLSYHGFAIQGLNEHSVVPYIDMSVFEYTEKTI